MKPIKLIVLVGSSGIVDNQKNISNEITSLFSNDLDTSNITTVENYGRKLK